MRASLIASLFLASLPVGAQAPDPVPAAVLDEVLVSGEQPGPGLWKATKDGHTLWILGTFGPLPAKMTWRSQEVESIVTGSQRVVKWVEVKPDIDIGFFSALAAIPSMFSAGDNPDKAKLKDVVTPAAYEQWLPLKAKYIGRDNDVEKLRPVFAALELRGKATKKVGLSYEADAEVWKSVQRIAKKRKVKILEPEVKMHIKIDNPRATIKKFKQTRIDDAACFEHALAQLESDLEDMKSHANAWATGNVDVLKKLPPPEKSTDCIQLLTNMFMNQEFGDEIGARDMIDRARAELIRVAKDMNDTWVRTVETELQSQPSVFAVAPIVNLVAENGPLQMLRDHGYQIEEP